jgi:urease accessory protein UreE
MSVLQVFKSLPVAHDVMREDALPASASGYVRDTITLDWEERLKARGRRRSDGGTEFGTALPRGTVLRSDDLLVVDASRVVISVVERSEIVFVVTPGSAREWGLFAYHIGNGHHPVMLTEQALVCPDVPGVESLLQYHQIPYERGLRAFTPVASVSPHGE